LSDLVEQHFKLDGGELAEASLPPAAVLGLLDPGDSGLPTTSSRRKGRPAGRLWCTPLAQRQSELTSL